MAEIILSVALEELLSKVVSLAASEFALGQSLKKELTRLSGTLNMIRTVLDDVERRQLRDEPVKLWLKKLKHVAYEADNVLDEVAYDILRRKVEIQNQVRRKVRFFFSASNLIVLRQNWAHKIKNINASLKTVNKEANDFGLQMRLVVDLNDNHQVNLNRETDSVIVKSETVGRENDLSEMMKSLIGSRDEEKLSVIPIVGMGGIGKTTLAKLIYNDELVKSNFDARVWVCVSHNFNVKTLLKDILESLTKNKYEIQSRDIIVAVLEKELGGKKFLLILDDVWSEDNEAWDSFRSCLLGISTTVGNKIVVTTRSTRVASVIKTHPAYNLEGLTAGACWSIFKERAFGPGGASMTPELMDIGFEIAKKCGGVPLAAKLIGSLMRSKERHDWVSIKDQGFWGLGGEEDGVSRILKLSFDHLPSSFLKQCFSYCSIFPKDCDIDKEQLIQLWMAVGFLRTNHNSKSMEDIGEEFFRFLVQSSLLQDVKKDSYNHLTGCRMHDLVHDLALSVSESEIFHSDGTLGSVDIFKARHVALYSDGEIISKISKEKARYLHTLFSSIKVEKNILSHFKCLRVLNFSGADIEELPNFISMLVHLRYLDLSDTNIKVLPYGISKLYNLQTLRLNYCRHLELQDELKNLISLRHLHISEYRYKKMPLEIGRLTCLRTLKFFNVGEENGRRTEELGSLINLSGELKLNFLDRVNGAEEAQRAKLFEKAGIYKLEFKWSSRRECFRNDEAVLEGLQPHPNLKSLTIEEFSGERFPTWMMNMAVSINAREHLMRLDNLVNIKLTECSRCEVIPMLGHLPLLRELELSTMQNLKCISASFYGDQNGLYSNGSTSSTNSGDDKMTAVFPELISFHLRNMPNLVEWVEAPVISDAAAAKTELSVAVFPRLAVLTIRDCPKLTTAPVNFPSLEKLWIKNCPELTTGVSHFPYLKELEIDGVENGSALAKISNLTTLTALRIIEAPLLTSLPDRLLHNNRNLTELKIEKCPLLRHVVNLGVKDGSNSSLRSLDISFCASLNMLLDGLHTLKSLEKLEVNSCPSLKSIPSLQGLRSLRHVSLRCEGLIYLPAMLLDSCVSLEEFRISVCPYLVSFPSLQSCIFLSALEIIDCKKLNFLPEGLWCLTRLKTLRIGPFSEELNSFPSLEGLQHLQLSLKRIELRGWDHWDSIPEQVQHLIALEELSIHGFGMMEVMPEWFGNFSSLKDLKLRGCKKLKHFPTAEAMGRLVNLKRVWILKCGNLCQPNWSEIPNINPAVIIEDRWDWYGIMNRDITGVHGSSRI